MVSQKVTVINLTGLHARPAAVSPEKQNSFNRRFRLRQVHGKWTQKMFWR